jgi:hypothetical protein
MANKIYNIDKEFEISLNLKVKVSQISNYFSLSKEDIENVLEDVKLNLKESLLNRIQQGNEFSDNLTEMVDYIMYSIEENK